jgi:SM-20-related protein
VVGVLFALDQFLTPTELERPVSHAINMVSKFSPASTNYMGGTNVLNLERRRAQVLMGQDTGEVGGLFNTKISCVMPMALEALQLPVRTPRRIIVQMTSTGDGGFYLPHSDNPAYAINRRLVSYVYFCHRADPLSFQGGDLRIYNTGTYAEIRRPDVPTYSVDPQANRIVFFHSDLIHEIRPVSCASDSLVDTRLTVNGWIYFG